MKNQEGYRDDTAGEAIQNSIRDENEKKKFVETFRELTKNLTSLKTFVEFDFSEDNTMDINTPIGSKVRFSFLENGNYYDVEKAKKYLKKK